MKNTTIFVFILALSGCNESSMLHTKAKYTCRDKGGLHYWGYKFGKPYVVCNNGELLRGIENVIIEDPQYYAKPKGGE